MAERSDLNILTDLPGNLVSDHILLKLPIKSLVQCSFVNKSMCNQISDPHFIDMHLNETSAIKDRYLILKHISDDEESEYYSLHCLETFDKHMDLEIPFGELPTGFVIAGSCNGLLFLLCPKSSDPGCSLHIWNPIIRYVKHIPDAIVPNSASVGYIAYGFGFLSTLNDYRVVRIVYRKKFREACPAKCPPSVELYSLRTDSWKRIETLMPYFVMDPISRRTLKGCVYWIARKKIDETCYSDFIVSFDLANEVFQETMLPDAIYRNVHRWVAGSILVFEESLYVFMLDLIDDEWGVWVMQESGSVKSWSKKFTVGDQEYLSMPHCFMDNGEVLFVNTDQNLAFYNPRNNVMIDYVSDEDVKTIGAIHFTESLVLLDEKIAAMRISTT